MSYVELIGFGAGALATCAFFPQVWKSWTSKSTRDISLASMSALAIANYIWIAYGVIIQSPPLIFTNSATGIMVTSLVILKARHG